MKKIMMTLGGLGAAVVLMTGTATAASLITANQMGTGSVTHRVIKDGAVHRADLTGKIQTTLTDVKMQRGEIDQITRAGSLLQANVTDLNNSVQNLNNQQHDLAATVHDQGVVQQDLKTTVNGLTTLNGAIYRVENYLNGGGGSATVACADDNTASQRYVAIAGGVQGSESGKTETPNGFAVSSSFPGRMDWSTGEPKPGRLDGWIVFGNGNYTSTLKVWALCVPATPNGFPVQQVNLDN